MQFSDGGYRPGYNVQFCTDTGSGIIVGVFCSRHGLRATAAHAAAVTRPRRVPEQAAGRWRVRGLPLDRAGRCHGVRVVYAPAQRRTEAARPKARTPTPRRQAMARACLRGGRGWARRRPSRSISCCGLSDGGMGERVGYDLDKCPSAALDKSRTVATLYAIAHNVLQACRLEHSQGKRPTEEVESGQAAALARDRRTASPMRQRGESRSSAQKTKKTRSPRRHNPKSHC